MLLEHVIHCARLHALDSGLLTDRARHHDEGNLGRALLCQTQSLHAVEVRQTVIGKNHVGRTFIQSLQIIRLGCDMTCGEIDLAPTQFALEQFCVLGQVFQNQDAQIVGH